MGQREWKESEIFTLVKKKSYYMVIEILGKGVESVMVAKEGLVEEDRDKLLNRVFNS